jgi:hypothetical protein
LPLQPGFFRLSGLKSEERFVEPDGVLLHPASPSGLTGLFAVLPVFA